MKLDSWDSARILVNAVNVNSYLWEATELLNVVPTHWWLGLGYGPLVCRAMS